MKRLTLLLLPILLCIILIACDTSGENTSEVSNFSETESSIGSESNISKTESSEESTSTENNSSTTEESSNTTDNSDSATTTIQKEFEISVTLHGTTALGNAGFSVNSGYAKNQKITIEGTKDVIDAFDSSKITADVDVSGASSIGTFEFLIVYKVPENVKVISTSAEYLSLEIIKKSDIPVTPPSDSAYITNGIIIVGNRGMEQFGGSAAGGEKTAQKLNEFKQAVGANVNVYIMPCPTSAAFYAPEKYPNSIKNTVNCFNGIKDNLVDVKYVDALTALSSHTDEYIYLRTDFHWSGLGGYYAAKELANVAGTPFDDISTFTEQSVDGVKGSLVRYASVLGNYPDTLYWYVPSRQHTVTYYSVSNFKNPISGRTLFSSSKGYTKFIYGDAYTTHIQSDINNGRKLLIFKDSYGNTLAPYVLSSFEEVYMADYREFKLNAKEFIQEHGITDVCFAMSAFAVNGSKRDYITKLLKY